ncbi:hypothetical protein KIN20_022832 [Parelaphostrongylus tenuis]|uniref:Uncharacterized protein n=1 Tax=Parelaphostrongylus tenuis TaxID=148309 RepID=A0AAD5MUN5_PARTN|nr:hypothetical protein KIN20_022832 [Parelaphostrongylus tenuis]
MDDQVLLTGELRQLHDTEAMRATVQVSSDWANVDMCPQCLTAESCHTVDGAALIVGKDQPIEVVDRQAENNSGKRRERHNVRSEANTI